jgi:hydrogenase small subunit
MTKINRREFVEVAGKLAALMGLGASAIPRLAEAAEQLARRAPVLWLQGLSCSGCSVSLLNSSPLTPARLLTRYISLVFHQTLSTATGHVSVEVVNKTIEQGGYILVVEGAVPAGMPAACGFGNEPFNGQLERAARRAKAVLAVGSCAVSGGIPAAENNPTGAVGVPAFLKHAGVVTPVISIPGCPVHPDWLVGTMVHVLKFGLPPLDESGRPKAFFSKLVHDQCPRFADYERENFAKSLGDEGCLFKLGCQGPLTRADCNLRLWNSGANACIRAGAPCVGCASASFAAKRDFPLYLQNNEREATKIKPL